MDINDGHDFLIIGDNVVYCNPIVKKALSDEILSESEFLDEEDVAHALEKARFFKQHGLKHSLDNSKMFTRMKPIEIERNIANLPQITFEVTDSCNLKCKYCSFGEFYDEHDTRTNQMLDEKKAFLLLDYLIDKWNSPLNTSHGRDVYVSFYGGEPLLNMDFIKQIVAFMKRSTLLYNKVRFSMTTNGLLIKKYLPFLIENDFRILISIDGNSEGHSYRVDHSGKNSFDRVFKNIQYIQKTYPEFFEANVNFNAVLHNRNSVESIYQFIKTEFGKIPSIAEVNNTGIRRDKWDDYFKTYRNTRESLYQAEDYSIIQQNMFLKLGEVRDIGLFLFKHSGNMFQVYNDLFVDLDNFKRFPTGTCEPFGKKMFLSVNGRILPCERVEHKYDLGVVDETGVLIDCKKIADAYNQHFDKLSNQCNNCYNAEVCEQCIFHLKNLNNNPVCQGHINQAGFQYGVNYRMHYLAEHKGVYSKLINELIFQD